MTRADGRVGHGPGRARGIARLAGGVCLTFALLSLIACRPAEIDARQLAEVDGLFLDRATGRPFTGEVTGSIRGRLENGRWDGRVTTFRADGEPNSEAHFQSGVMHGMTRTWHAGGRIASEARYRRGVLQGPLRRWFDNGREESVKHFENGLAHGPEYRYARNGEMRVSRSWQSGQLHGLEVHYCIDGLAPGTDTGRCSALAGDAVAPVIRTGDGGVARRTWCHAHGHQLDHDACAAQVAGTAESGAP